MAKHLRVVAKRIVSSVKAQQVLDFSKWQHIEEGWYNMEHNKKPDTDFPAERRQPYLSNFPTQDTLIGLKVAN